MGQEQSREGENGETNSSGSRPDQRQAYLHRLGIGNPGMRPPPKTRDPPKFQNVDEEYFHSTSGPGGSSASVLLAGGAGRSPNNSTTTGGVTSGPNVSDPAGDPKDSNLNDSSSTTEQKSSSGAQTDSITGPSTGQGDVPSGGTCGESGQFEPSTGSGGPTIRMGPITMGPAPPRASEPSSGGLVVIGGGESEDDFQMNLLSGNQDDFRLNFLRKLSYQKIWVPHSQRPPQHQTVVIFDWDDTLLCTSFLNLRLPTPEIPSHVQKQLALLEKVGAQLLEQAMNLGQTFIITNAMRGWVEYSASKYVPRLLPILQKITIISARGNYEHQYPGNYGKWKIEAFLEVQRQMETEIITNLISLGDSTLEMDAVYVMGGQFSQALIKTIKFRESPTPEELVKQLELVSQKFEKIILNARNLKIGLERKWNPKSQGSSTSNNTTAANSSPRLLHHGSSGQQQAASGSSGGGHHGNNSPQPNASAQGSTNLHKQMLMNHQKRSSSAGGGGDHHHPGSHHQPGGSSSSQQSRPGSSSSNHNKVDQDRSNSHNKVDQDRSNSSSSNAKYESRRATSSTSDTNTAAPELNNFSGTVVPPKSTTAVVEAAVEAAPMKPSSNVDAEKPDVVTDTVFSKSTTADGSTKGTLPTADRQASVAPAASPTQDQHQPSSRSNSATLQKASDSIAEASSGSGPPQQEKSPSQQKNTRFGSPPSQPGTPVETTNALMPPGSLPSNASSTKNGSLVSSTQSGSLPEFPPEAMLAPSLSELKAMAEAGFGPDPESVLGLTKDDTT